jgi:hypothetical protein
LRDDDSNIDNDLENICLYHNSTKVTCVDKTDTKYVTFNFENPILIKDGNTERFIVKADVVAGASDTIKLYLDNVLDVTLTASRNMYAKVADATNNNGTIVSSLLTAANQVTIQAGQVVITSEDPVNTDVLKDKDNIVFGTFTVKANAGKDLYIDKVAYKLTLTDPNTNSDLVNTLENVELYDVTHSINYDTDSADPAAGVDSYEYNFKDLDITLKDGESITFQIRADTKKSATAGHSITAEISTITNTADGNGYIVIKENADDKQVTDITPSSISFKKVDIVAPSIAINKLTQSTSYDAVIGAK